MLNVIDSNEIWEFAEMAMKRQIIIGCILFALALALMVFLLKGDSQGDYRKLQGTVSQVSINAPWYNGQIITEGESHPLRYRRYDPPILLTKEFRLQQETTNVSPLHTALSYWSRMSRDGGITKEEALAYYSDPEYVIENSKKYKHPVVPGKEEDCSGWIVLGEIIFKNYTLIVSQIPDDDPEPFYVGHSIITEGGQHLLDPEAKPREIVLQRLSGDQYSLVTGLTYSEYCEVGTALKKYTIVRDTKDPQKTKEI